MMLHVLQAASPNPTVTLAVISLIGVAFTALAGYLSARFAGKQADKAATATATNVAKQADTDGWDKLVKSLQTELGRLADRVEGLEKQGDEDRARITTLETNLRLNEAKYRTALQYVRDIIGWAKLAFGSEKIPPNPPAEIADDL